MLGGDYRFRSLRRVLAEFSIVFESTGSILKITGYRCSRRGALSERRRRAAELAREVRTHAPPGSVAIDRTL